MSDTKSFSAQDVLKKLRDSKQIHLTTTGPRDTGQSDYKNRHTFSDLIRLAPLYEDAGYFSVEMHGGARFHQNLLSNMLDPFEEAAAWKSTLNNTLTYPHTHSSRGARQYALISTNPREVQVGGGSNLPGCMHALWEMHACHPPPHLIPKYGTGLSRWG